MKITSAIYFLFVSIILVFTNSCCSEKKCFPEDDTSDPPLYSISIPILVDSSITLKDSVYLSYFYDNNYSTPVDSTMLSIIYNVNEPFSAPLDPINNKNLQSFIIRSNKLSLNVKVNNISILTVKKEKKYHCTFTSKTKTYTNKTIESYYVDGIKKDGLDVIYVKK